MDRPRHSLCLPDFQSGCAEIHLEYHRDLSQEERTIKSRIRTLLPDITDEAMVAWIVYVDEVGRHGCFTPSLFFQFNRFLGILRLHLQGTTPKIPLR